MDCQEAQEQILESLAEIRPGARAADVESHLAGCALCRRFSETQLALDRQLSAMIDTPPLSPAFRVSLRKKVDRDPLQAWPEFLPDIAHFVGCAFAIALCVVLLPLPAGPTILAGLEFTLATYFVQSAIRGALELWQE